MSALRALASCSRPACVRCVPYSTRAVLKTQEHPCVRPMSVRRVVTNGGSRRGEQDVAESSRNDPNERGPDGEAPRRAKMPISFLDKSCALCPRFSCLPADMSNQEAHGGTRGDARAHPAWRAFGLRGTNAGRAATAEGPARAALPARARRVQHVSGAVRAVAALLQAYRTPPRPPVLRPPLTLRQPPVPGYVVAARYRTISKIQDVVSRWYEPRRVRRGQMYEVRAFGSTEYGADSPQSDLDLVIVVGAPLSVHNEVLIRVAGPLAPPRPAPARGQEADAG
jgi:hypothetical protein